MLLCLNGGMGDGFLLEIFFAIFYLMSSSVHLLILSQLVQPLSHVWFSVTPWTAARQTSLSFTVSQSLLKLMSIKSVMPSNHVILCHPLLLLPSVFPSIRVFSSESVLHIRCPKYWGFSFTLVFECWVLSQLFHCPLSLSSRGSSVPLRFLPYGGVICISEIIDTSPSSLDSSLCFIQPSTSHDVFCI